MKHIYLSLVGAALLASLSLSAQEATVMNVAPKAQKAEFTLQNNVIEYASPSLNQVVLGQSKKGLSTNATLGRGPLGSVKMPKHYYATENVQDEWEPVPDGGSDDANLLCDAWIVPFYMPENVDPINWANKVDLYYSKTRPGMLKFRDFWTTWGPTYWPTGAKGCNQNTNPQWIWVDARDHEIIYTQRQYSGYTFPAGDYNDDKTDMYIYDGPWYFRMIGHNAKSVILSKGFGGKVYQNVQGGKLDQVQIWYPMLDENSVDANGNVQMGGQHGKSGSLPTYKSMIQLQHGYLGTGTAPSGATPGGGTKPESEQGGPGGDGGGSGDGGGGSGSGDNLPDGWESAFYLNGEGQMQDMWVAPGYFDAEYIAANPYKFKVYENRKVPGLFLLNRPWTSNWMYEYNDWQEPSDDPCDILIDARDKSFIRIKPQFTGIWFELYDESGNYVDEHQYWIANTEGYLFDNSGKIDECKAAMEENEIPASVWSEKLRFYELKIYPNWIGVTNYTDDPTNFGFTWQDANGDMLPYYTVIQLPKAPNSGIDDIKYGEDTTGTEPVTYYNMQGQPVADPQPGTLVIRRQGNSARTVLVK